MRKNVLYLLARQLWKDAFRSKVMNIALGLMAFLLVFSALSGWVNYHDQNYTRNMVQHEVQESWENNPDKHPHRMSHYGSFALRIKKSLTQTCLPVAITKSSGVSCCSIIHCIRT